MRLSVFQSPLFETFFFRKNDYFLLVMLFGTYLCTLDSGINIGVRLLFFGLFSRGYVLIREGNAYFFSKYLLFDGIGDAYFKGYA